MSDSKKTEIKKLHALGFGIHHLHPKQKVPVKSGWSSDNRDSLETLMKEYKSEYNVGTKLGKPSHIKTDFGDEGYLAVIDVDVKGSSEKHKNAAKAKVNELFPGLLDKAPVTLSGRGNGSMHVWCLVDAPIDSKAVYASNEQVEVHMPSAKATENQIKVLGAEKVKKGIRLRPAFEIDFMCAGRQVVLPPSIHPDTGKKYKWEKPIDSALDIPFIDSKILEKVQTAKKSHAGRPSGGSVQMITPIDVPEMELEMRLKSDVVNAIVEGTNVGDRSAYCLSAALYMLRAGFSDEQVVGVLTCRDFFIGDVGYEHAQTTNRMKAARWVERYVLAKAKTELSDTKDFDCEVEVYETLEPEKAALQAERITKNKKEVIEADWRFGLDRTQKGELKNTFKNHVLIIENDIGHGCIRKNLFANREIFFIEMPWGSKSGTMINNEDVIRCKMWFAQNWEMEPSVKALGEAFTEIAARNSFHPVKSYLESLWWDGKPRLNTWIKDFLGGEAAEPYLSEVSRKFLIAAVARIYEPGKKFDNVLIFEGLQGIGKSTVGRILATDEYFLDNLPDLHDKDAALNLHGNWIIEMGELSSLKRTDVETVKSFITRQIDKLRPPFKERVEEFPRQCIFFGTTNSSEYLKDKSGNRRFWPVKINGVDFGELRKVRNQLWAEALTLYEMGDENLYLENEAIEQAVEEQKLRVTEDMSDVMEASIQTWLNALNKARRDQFNVNGGKPLKAIRFTTKELFDDFASDEIGGKPPLGEFKVDNYNLQLATQALKRCGLEKKKFTGNRKWVIPEYSGKVGAPL